MGATPSGGEVTVPETRYARSGSVNIAYQVVGEGQIDLVFVMGWVSNLDYFWEEPGFARFLRRLASFSRLILFDKRGTGLSDRVSEAELPTLEQRMDDVRAVMDAVGSRRAALVGVSEGGPMCALFAATYPERTSALILVGAFPRRDWAPDYPWGHDTAENRRLFNELEDGWGGPVALDLRAPSMLHNDRFRKWWATFLRMSASPGAAEALSRMNMEIDVRGVLPTIRVPTLLIHRTGDRTRPVEESRYMARRIAGAKLVELPGDDHLPFVGDQDAILDEIEQFLTGVRPPPQSDRVLATVLCTEIAHAVETATRIGDSRWREVVETHNLVVREELERFRGREMKITADGFLATFDGPARAIRCALAIVDATARLGIRLRAGVHTGECELVNGDVQGVAVHIAGRVLAEAEPGEVLVSSVVKDLVAGSGLTFTERGGRELGVVGQWRMFVATEGAAALTAPQPRDLPRPRVQTALTEREREVAGLLALGFSNRQIADELVISRATAERHVANIRNKLGFHSRSQVAAWAVEQGLLRTPST